MAFHVYPDPATAPVVVSPGATSDAIPVVELTAPFSDQFNLMVITIACTAPDLASTPPTPAPTVSLSADGGTAVPITSVGNVNPTPIATGQVLGTVIAEGSGVYRVQLLKEIAAPIIAWTVELTNNASGDAWFTWVVADDAGEARQPWVEIPPVLDWDTALGTVLTGQDVPLTVPVGNRGTGRLTLGNFAGTVGSSSFEVVAVPGTWDPEDTGFVLQPGKADALELVFHAPATPGQESGVELDLASNDPEAMQVAPAHPTSTDLAASRGRLEVMLLLDASGSMARQPDGTQTVSASDARWAKLVVAAEQFLTLLSDFGDGLGRFGVAVFPDITDPASRPTALSAAHLHPPEEISPGAITTAIAALAAAGPPGGVTPMGFGLGHTMGDTAGSFGDFEGTPEARAHNRRVVVLMSDGAHNSGDHPSVYWRADEGNGCPDQGTAAAGRSFADKAVRAITIAYGDPAVTAFEVDHDLLALIACKSGGTALDAQADDAGLDLLKTFQAALTDGLALDPALDPNGLLTARAPSVRRTVQVLPADEQVSFVVDWVTDARDRLRVDLLTPLCELISSTGHVPPGVSVHRASRFVVVTITPPFLRNDEDPQRPRYGEWTLVLAADDLGPHGLERYQYSVLTRSRLQLRLRTGSSGYVAGDTIELAADLRLDGSPVRQATVTVHDDRPGQAAANWLAALPVTAREMTRAQRELDDPEATAVGIKTHALHRRGERFDPMRTTGTQPMTPSPDGRHLRRVPGTSTPGTYTFRAVATGELDGVLFCREQCVQVRVGMRPDPGSTVVDVAYRSGGEQQLADVRIWPRDPFGNAVMIDPAIDPAIDILVSGAQPVSRVRTGNDGSYGRTMRLAPGRTRAVTVAVGGRVVVRDRTVPPPSGLFFADRVVEYRAGAEAKQGANRHTDPETVLGPPTTRPRRGFLALGAGGHVTVAVGRQHVLARGADDVNVFSVPGDALRGYRVQARHPGTGQWVDLGSSHGPSASFSLATAGLTSTPQIRVVDTSGRTRDPDLSVSTAPGAHVAAVGFRAVGKAPPRGLGAPAELTGRLDALVRRLRARLRRPQVRRRG